VQQYNQISAELSIFQADPQSAAYFQQQQQQVVNELGDPATLGRGVINQLVDDMLIRMEASRRGITVSPQEVDEAYKALYGYFPNGTPTSTITPTVAPTHVPPTVNPTVAA